MMSFSHDCRLLVALALFICFCCVKADPPPCSWLSKSVTSPTISTNGSLFTLSFPANHSFSFTSAASSDTMLAFITLVPSSIESMQPGFITCTRQHFTLSGPLAPDACNPHPVIQVTPATYNCSSQLGDLDETLHSADELLLTYNASAASLQVQADFDCDGFSCNMTFSTTGLPPDDAVDTITLLVGFISISESTINRPSGHSYAMDDGHAKPNHRKVVVWVIVGVSMIGLFIGFLILVLFITKRRRRPSLVTSRPATHGAPPLATSRPPFSHRDLESSATPMMKALPLSPPHKDSFQISGTASSWLKQPNAR